nr:hypothetical protein CFP56_33793 [Quercus suber]
MVRYSGFQSRLVVRGPSTASTSAQQERDGRKTARGDVRSRPEEKGHFPFTGETMRGARWRLGRSGRSEVQGI